MPPAQPSIEDDLFAWDPSPYDGAPGVSRMDYLNDLATKLGSCRVIAQIWILDDLRTPHRWLLINEVDVRRGSENSVNDNTATSRFRKDNWAVEVRVPPGTTDHEALIGHADYVRILCNADTTMNCTVKRVLHRQNLRKPQQPGPHDPSAAERARPDMPIQVALLVATDDSDWGQVQDTYAQKCFEHSIFHVIAQRHRRRFDALGGLAMALSTPPKKAGAFTGEFTSDLQKLLMGIAEHIRESIDAQACLIFRLNGSDGLRSTATAPLTSDGKPIIFSPESLAAVLAKPRPITPGTAIRLRDIHDTLEASQTLGDGARPDLKGLTDCLLRLKLKSVQPWMACAIPSTDGSRAVGVVVLLNNNRTYRVGQFTLSDQLILESMCQLLSTLLPVQTAQLGTTSLIRLFNDIQLSTRDINSLRGGNTHNILRPVGELLTELIPGLSSIYLNPSADLTNEAGFLTKEADDRVKLNRQKGEPNESSRPIIANATFAISQSLGDDKIALGMALDRPQLDPHEKQLVRAALGEIQQMLEPKRAVVDLFQIRHVVRSRFNSAKASLDSLRDLYMSNRHSGDPGQFAKEVRSLRQDILFGYQQLSEGLTLLESSRILIQGLSSDKLQRREVLIPREVTYCMDIARHLAELREVTFPTSVTDLSAGQIPIRIPKLDVELLRIGLLNLLENAAKYATPGTSVEVKYAVDNSGWSLSIANECRPIPADNVRRLFAPFTRYIPEGQSGPTGTGLGLTVTKSIIEAHGGKIDSSQKRSIDGNRSYITFTILCPF